MIERIEINLLPAEYRFHRKTIKLQREIVYPVLGVLLVAFGLALYTFNMESQITQLKSDILRTEESFKKNKPIKDEIARLKDNKKIVEGKIVALERITVDRGKWVRLMEIICQRLPDFTWLISCEEKDSTIVIEGRTFSFPEVANYMTRLSESKYIKAVDLSGIEQKDALKTFSFIISCKINPEAEMDNVSSQETASKIKSHQGGVE
ncbi:MAG: PilN domain-containing protein [Chitinivibrionales bacterium]